MTVFRSVFVPIAIVTMVPASMLVAQAGSSQSGAASSAPMCVSTPAPTTPTAEQQRQARDIAEQARQASMVDESAKAKALFKRAAELDPTDANTMYALARAYDADRENRSAIATYCRFLALSPAEKDAATVRTRIAELVSDTTPSRAKLAGNTVSPRIPRAGQSPTPSNGIFALATVMPGLGQYYTDRPVLGAAITTTALAALYWGLQSQHKTVTRQLSRNRTVTQTVDERPHLAQGVTLAAGISIMGAIESYMRVHSPERDAPRK